MSINHLLSTSLYTELFHHNIVSPDGRIIANDEQIEEYYTFLIKQSKQKIVNLYLERKNMVDAVQKLLRQRFRTDEQNKLLKRLLNELDLQVTDDGLLSLKEPKKSKKRYPGPSEPKMTLFERQIEAELKRVEVLKRDLRLLDNWLEEISNFRPIAEQKQHVDYKEAEVRFRKRTRNRMNDMERSRAKLIKEHYNDYEQSLKRVLVPKHIPKWVYPRKKDTQIKKPRDEKEREREPIAGISEKSDEPIDVERQAEEEPSETEMESSSSEEDTLEDSSEEKDTEEDTLEDSSEKTDTEEESQEEKDAEKESRKEKAVEKESREEKDAEEESREEKEAEEESREEKDAEEESREEKNAEEESREVKDVEAESREEKDTEEESREEEDMDEEPSTEINSEGKLYRSTG